MNNQQNKLVIFQSKKIRRLWHNEEWYFSVVDVCGALMNSSDDLTARKYWNKLSQRLRKEGSEVVTNCHRLKLEATDGKMRQTDCANTKGIFRIIQSIPSKKAEPFKQWLAQVGKERLNEIEKPELSQKRMKDNKVAGKYCKIFKGVIEKIIVHCPFSFNESFSIFTYQFSIN